ncbi:amino acid ABC transporter permease [Pectinatus frisingensis]|uniref:amino acid ABC transporter permease n=1 Tax=Pectinatus frisingensis TaxID=865 RepID=UPI0018C73513|nr:amino acid ABC transporter permease [Pectinatus frisingensis]
MQDLGIRVLFDGENGVRLLLGLVVTLKLSIITIIASCLLGTLMGLLMTLRNPIIHIVTRVYLEFIRIMPQLVLLFVTYFGLTRAVGINLSGFTAAVIVFILWGTAEMGDLVRSAFISIPKDQYESGTALGFSKLQLYRFIILPQALRQIIPPAMNLATRMIMTTSLVVLIGVVEMLKTGQQIIEANRYTAPSAALWIYGTIFFLYFFSCWPLTILAQHLEKKWEK